jgi:hypothetical protein
MSVNKGVTISTLQDLVQSVCVYYKVVCVYYCSTYYKAVREGEGGAVCLLLQYLLQSSRGGGGGMEDMYYERLRAEPGVACCCLLLQYLIQRCARCAWGLDVQVLKERSSSLGLLSFKT